MNPLLVQKTNTYSDLCIVTGIRYREQFIHVIVTNCLFELQLHVIVNSNLVSVFDNSYSFAYVNCE